MLGNEIERLQNAVRVKIEENEALKVTISRLELQIRDTSGYENEIRRLRDILDLKTKEVEALRAKYSYLDKLGQDRPADNKVILVEQPQRVYTSNAGLSNTFNNYRSFDQVRESPSRDNSKRLF